MDCHCAECYLRAGHPWLAIRQTVSTLLGRLSRKVNALEWWLDNLSFTVRVDK